MIGQIELTAVEQELAGAIVFDMLRTDLEYKQAIENGKRAATLMKRLVERKAIPDSRRRYFMDAEYNSGRGNGSRFERFKSKVGSAAAVLRHAHFLPYLHYFIYGADLPVGLKEEFLQKAEDPWVKPHELAELTRSLVRKYDLPRHPANYRLKDTFFQLAIDCDCDVGTARSVREAVMRVK